MPVGRKTRLSVLRGQDVPPELRGDLTLLTLGRVFGRMTDAMSRLVKTHGLSLPHFEVLLCLRSGEGISQQDLSERLLLTKGNICVIVQKMEAAGLIERKVDPADQRYHRLYLMDSGRKLLAQVRPEHQALNRRILSKLPPADQKTLYELLVRLEQSLDDIDAE